jgi:hypothetical protein
MTIITYHITSDVEGKLRSSAKLACSFWNFFIQPSNPTVIRLGKFYRFGNTIARAFEPYTKDGTVYGVVEFNSKFLKRYSREQIAGTIIHEIGHTLGIGWAEWMSMFDRRTGRFKASWIKRQPALRDMLVETDYGPGTTLSHWDEEKFDKEIMTGIKDDFEFVSPVTISVLELFGHTVLENLSEDTPLKELLVKIEKIKFSREEEAISIERDAFVETEIWEEIYDVKRSKSPA